MTFRFAAKYGLLTYAQCGNLDPWAVNDHLGRLGAECIIGREDHEDGGVHLHAFFMFERRFESRNVRVFDVAGRHPNVVAGYSTPEKGWAYATKDGDVVAGGLEQPIGRAGLSEAGSKWARVILAESREEFFALVAELDPRALCCSFGSLRAYADWRYRPTLDPYVSPPGVSFSTDQFPELGHWVQRNLEGSVVGKHPLLRKLRGARPSIEMLGVPLFVVLRTAPSRATRSAQTMAPTRNWGPCALS